MHSRARDKRQDLSQQHKRTRLRHHRPQAAAVHLFVVANNTPCPFVLCSCPALLLTLCHLSALRQTTTTKKKKGQIAPLAKWHRVAAARQGLHQLQRTCEHLFPICPNTWSNTQAVVLTRLLKLCHRPRYPHTHHAIPKARHTLLLYRTSAYVYTSGTARCIGLSVCLSVCLSVYPIASCHIII